MIAQTAEKPRTALMQAQSDARADGGVRQVRVTRSNILILRRLAGVSMRILAPVANYRGVSLAVEPAHKGGAAYRLLLAHRQDPDFDVVLAETLDAQAAAADWGYWADYLDLPRLADAQGEDKRPGRCERRRGGGLLAKRRPRFLNRRKCGEAGRVATVFAEREIICYE